LKEHKITEVARLVSGPDRHCPRPILRDDKLFSERGHAACLKSISAAIGYRRHYSQDEIYTTCSTRSEYRLILQAERRQRHLPVPLGLVSSASCYDKGGLLAIKMPREHSQKMS